MPPKKLTEKLIEKILENEDWSDNDSDDDLVYGDFIISPSRSFLQQNEEDRIEMRLEEMFGIDDLGDTEHEETTNTLQTCENLLEILNPEHPECTILEKTPSDTGDNANFEIQSGSLNLISDSDLPVSIEHEIGLDTNQQIVSTDDPFQQEIIYEDVEQLDSNIDENLVSEEDLQIPLSSTVERNRSQPRKWEICRTTHDIPNFTKKFQPKSECNHKTQPITIFEKFFPDYLIQLIVEQTNRYARYKNSKNWIEVNENDIRAYLGILILMGLNPLPDMELYWSSDSFYNNPEISRVFPIARFKKITENLHLNDNSIEPPRDSINFDKLYKLKPLITTLNEVYQNEAYNSSVQSIDECMVKFKGRCSLKQYMPKKPIKRGFKIWARCDAKTGYLYQFQIYTGKGDSIENEGLGYNVVMKLSNYLPMNTLVAFDNFFTGCNLLEHLYNKHIYAVGTVRSNRKDLPEMMKKQRKELRLQKHQFSAVTSEPITAIKWLDTKEVTLLTTAHQPLDIMYVKRTQKNGSRVEVLCPKAIASYTMSMGGVDLFDHYRSSYPINRKSRKFWMRLFFFMFDASIINSYITYSVTHAVTPHSHREFRLRLARALINNYSQKKARPRIPFTSKKGGPFGVPKEIRLLNVGIHMPQESNTYKRCRFCSTRKREKRTKIVCSTCTVPLCIKDCFERFHTTEIE